MSTTTLTDKNVVASTEAVLRDRFNQEVTKYTTDIKLMAEKRHKSFDNLVEILWRKFKRAQTKHDAKTIALAKAHNERAGLIVKPTSVDWADAKVIAFTNWFTSSCSPTVDVLGRQIKAKINITNDRTFDSIQDAYMFYLAHLDTVPATAKSGEQPVETQWMKLIMSKAKYLRMDQGRRDAGLMSNGKESKTYGRYAHVQNSYDRAGDNYIYNYDGEAPTGIKIKGASVA